MKNMLAMLCSNPDATNAVIGKKMAKIFQVTSSEAVLNQTAKHTSQLQAIPRHKASVKERVTFEAAVESAATPRL